MLSFLRLALARAPCAFSLFLTSLLSSSSPGRTRAASHAAAAAAASPARGRADGGFAGRCVGVDDDDDDKEGFEEGLLGRVRGGLPGRSMLDMSRSARSLRRDGSEKGKKARRERTGETRKCCEMKLLEKFDCVSFQVGSGGFFFCFSTSERG